MKNEKYYQLKVTLVIYVNENHCNKVLLVSPLYISRILLLTQPLKIAASYFSTYLP